MTRLIQSFPFNGFDEALIRRYNRIAAAELEGIRDFIILHYHQTERDDTPFWNHVRTMTIPDSLAQRIALFRDDAQAYQAPDDLFRVDSWMQVMLGQRCQPRGYHHIARMLPPDQLRQALTDLKTNIANAVTRLPSHQAFIAQYCGSVAS